MLLNGLWSSTSFSATARPRGEHSTDWGPAGMGAALFVPMGLRARRADEQEVVCQPHPRKYLKNPVQS